MACLRLLRRRSVSCAGYGLMTIMMPAVRLLDRHSGVFVLFLLGFGCGSLDLPVTAFQGLSMPSLSFCGFLCIKISREAVCAEMLIWPFLAVIVAFYVVPSVTPGAIDGVAVIICVDANTFDGVFLLILYVVV